MNRVSLMNRYFFKIFILLLMTVTVYAEVWNSPYPSDKSKKEILFSSFSLPYKHLDPVVSYSKRESMIISNIYEPVVGYNYLKRPYTLEPLTLTNTPEIVYLNKEKKEVNEESTEVAFSCYTFHLRNDISYQNHPAFSKNSEGNYLYHHLSQEVLEEIKSLNDFKEQGSRKLVASDYAYAIKRMAVRQNHSPILDIIQEYLVGLEAFSKEITQIAKEKKSKNESLDLRAYHIKGVKVIDDYTFTITLKGKYPQFLYWMSMNFFAPIPWEADLFYQQKG